ncbi:hypothetical protein C7M84_007178 [Penaeus vannamei]|uniref:Uncharacterized protein n=1 Tax=Penaeus vannamei TaxID=6689 RepID=A0A3R7M6I7_PENVA|nr:hypothetical protein C7M84_007178 [Penaeus vannamei]
MLRGSRRPEAAPVASTTNVSGGRRLRLPGGEAVAGRLRRDAGCSFESRRRRRERDLGLQKRTQRPPGDHLRTKPLMTPQQRCPKPTNNGESVESYATGALRLPSARQYEPTSHNHADCCGHRLLSSSVAAFLCTQEDATSFGIVSTQSTLIHPSNHLLIHTLPIPTHLQSLTTHQPSLPLHQPTCRRVLPIPLTYHPLPSFPSPPSFTTHLLPSATYLPNPTYHSDSSTLPPFHYPPPHPTKPLPPSTTPTQSSTALHPSDPLPHISTASRTSDPLPHSPPQPPPSNPLPTALTALHPSDPSPTALHSPPPASLSLRQRLLSRWQRRRLGIFDSAFTRLYLFWGVTALETGRGGAGEGGCSVASTLPASDASAGGEKEGR